MSTYLRHRRPSQWWYPDPSQTRYFCSNCWRWLQRRKAVQWLSGTVESWWNCASNGQVWLEGRVERHRYALLLSLATTKCQLRHSSPLTAVRFAQDRRGTDLGSASACPGSYHEKRLVNFRIDGWIWCCGTYLKFYGPSKACLCHRDFWSGSDLHF